MHCKIHSKKIKSNVDLKTIFSKRNFFFTKVIILMLISTNGKENNQFWTFPKIWYDDLSSIWQVNCRKALPVDLFFIKDNKYIMSSLALPNELKFYN